MELISLVEQQLHVYMQTLWSRCHSYYEYLKSIWLYLKSKKSVSTQFISLANQTPPTLSFKRIQIFIYHLLPKPSRSFDHLPPSRNNHIHPHNLCVSHFRSIIHPPTLNTEPSPTTWRRTVSKPGNHQRRANNNLEGRRKLEDREISKRGEEKKRKNSLENDIYENVLDSFSAGSPSKCATLRVILAEGGRSVVVLHAACSPVALSKLLETNWASCSILAEKTRATTRHSRRPRHRGRRAPRGGARWWF